MRPILVTGAAGMLGSVIVEEARLRNDIPLIAANHQQIDISDPLAVSRMRDHKVIVINCAGVTTLKDGPASMIGANSYGPHLLAVNFTRVIQVSTDCVFRGLGLGGYSEQSPADPDTLYGRSKLAGELAAPHLTVRTSFVGLNGGLLRWALMHPGPVIPGYVHHYWTGLYVRPLARILLDLAYDLDAVGLLHIYGERQSKYDLLKSILGRLRPDITVSQDTTTRMNRALSSDREDLAHYNAAVPVWEKQLEEIENDYRRDTGRA